MTHRSWSNTNLSPKEKAINLLYSSSLSLTPGSGVGPCAEKNVGIVLPVTECEKKFMGPLARQ